MILVPDFVSIAGPLLGGVLEGDEATIAAKVAQRVIELLSEAGDHPDGVLLGACYLAENFIETWQERKPFGRPLAA